MTELQVDWRGDFDNQELNALHAEAFPHAILEIDWTSQVKAHSLGWVIARDAGELVGFVNVAWDGDIHAFILDTMSARVGEDRGSARGLLPSLRLRRALLDVNGFTSISMKNIDCSISMPADSKQHLLA